MMIVALALVLLIGALLLVSRRASAQLRRQADLLDQAQDAIFAWERGGQIAYWNRGAEALYGWPAAEARGRMVHALLQTEHPASIAAIEQTVVREGRWEGILRQTTRSGRQIDVEARLVLARYGRQATYIIESTRDVTARLAAERRLALDLTERKRAEQARDESEARLRAIFDTAADAIITIDERGIVDRFNAAAERIFGYRADEVVGRNVSMLMPEPFRSAHDGYLARHHRTGERRVIGYGREVLGRRADGTVFPLDLALSETVIGDQRIYTGILRDITDRRRIEEEREHLLASERAARGEAERAARMRDEFVATVSHELRTPLNAILGWSSMLRKGRRDAATLDKALAVIERNAHAQAQIVEDLLDVSRILSGKLRFDVRRLELAPVVENAVAAVLPAAEAKGVRVERALHGDPVPVQGDPARLEQVAINLLTNAVKFTPRGGCVRVALRRGDASVDLLVCDTGQGIRPELLPHIFDRYRQGDSSITRTHAGLGLGLSLVKHLVEQHGGEVRAESEGEGRGATFVVSLPLAGDQRMNAHRCNPLDACASLHGVRVLVVDDEADAREIVRRILEECGADVVAVGSASEAIEQIPRSKPDVLLSDIGMPERDGYHLMRTVRALPPEQGGKTPAVALTAFTRPEDRIRALRVGYQMHLTKPVDQAELIVVVANLAGRVAA